MKPIVAIVGRPNTGKSTLFNRISRERRSLVDDVPGVTRDRIYNAVTWHGRSFILIDTGGFEPASAETLMAQMREQTQLAIEEADIILFLLDAREGLTPSDKEISIHLRSSGKPLHYAVNKVDGPRHEPSALEFYELGADPLHLISAKYGRNVPELLDELTGKFSSEDAPRGQREEGIGVAVVGRPNVGKSLLVNLLCGEPRVLVSQSPGTTRDAIDTDVRWHGKRFMLIDTAGIRRKSRTRLPLDKYCALKALQSIDRCDVALLLVDATEGITDQDARIGGYIYERGRGCLLLANKWDLIQKSRRTHDEFLKEIYRAMPHLDFAPVLTVSAKTGQRVGRLLSLVERVNESCVRRVNTAALNQFFRTWTAEHSPPAYRGAKIKFYYVTQPDIAPPTFVAFCNRPDGVPEAYRRYLTRRIREQFDFTGAPIRLFLKPKARR